jgi:hypothetical protein
MLSFEYWARPPVDHDGPDIEVPPLDERGAALRALLLLDCDKGRCAYELFDGDLEHPWVCVEESGIGVLPLDRRLRIPLRERPLTTEDFEALFIEAAKLADASPLQDRDLVEAARLVPEGSGLEGLPVRGLPFSIAVSEPDQLGMYIQNYSYCGAFLQVHSVQKC